jgi:Domain of unknown function (DUF3332)
MRRALIVLAALALTQSACFGSFAATRSLYGFNKGVSGDKFVQELVFLALVIIPAYGLFALGDALIFNTIEFWGGSNPINADASQPREREVMLADGSTARLVHDEAGMRIEHGDDVYLVQRTADGLTFVGKDGAVLSTLREGEGGAVEVTNAAGETRVVRADELAAAGNSPESVTAWTLARAAQ